MASLLLPTPRDFNFRSVIRSHGWSLLDPFRSNDHVASLERIERLSSGLVVVLAFRPAPDRQHLAIDVSGAGDLPVHLRNEILGAARRIFNLDLDLTEFYALLQSDDRYAWVRQSGAGRLLRSPTVWEDLVKTLMTTNTLWAGTSRMIERITRLGSASADGLYAFPSPEQIAAISPDRLSQTVRAGYRTAPFHALAVSICEGRLDVESWSEPGTDTQALYRSLIALKGFGPYAAGTMLKLLGHFDRLALDTACRKAFSETYRAGARFADAGIEAHYGRYGRWRGLVNWMDVLRWAELRDGATACGVSG